MVAKINEFSQSLVGYAFSLMRDENIIVTLSAQATNRVFTDIRSILSAFANCGLNQIEAKGYAIRNAIEDLRNHIVQEAIDSKNSEIRAHEIMRSFLALMSNNF